MPAIGAGDLLKVSVLGVPDSDQEVRVGADGNIFLNFIGPVHVAGLTTEKAQDVIAKKLAAGGFYTDPQVSVFAKEYATQGVSVLGEVQRPGVYPLLGARNLFDVLSLAGGTTPKAGRVINITHRDTPQTPTSVTMSNDAAKSVHSQRAHLSGRHRDGIEGGHGLCGRRRAPAERGGDGKRHRDDGAAGHRHGRGHQFDGLAEQRQDHP